MDTVPMPGDNAQAARFESAPEAQRRPVQEAEMIAEARAELDAGLYVDADEVDAWIDSIGTDHELPPPPTRRL
jgi:predicted transcriptional regulator